MAHVQLSEQSEFLGVDWNFRDWSYSIGDCFVVSESRDPKVAMALLERALETAAPVIIIEPMQLGEETSRWIRVGNFLHKTAVLSAVGCVAVGALWTKYSSVTTACVGLGVVSFTCASIYAASWQFDPCCKYQPVNNGDVIRRLPIYELVSTSPVVLERRDDTRRKWLQNVLATAAAVMCIWRLWWGRHGRNLFTYRL